MYRPWLSVVSVCLAYAVTRLGLAHVYRGKYDLRDVRGCVVASMCHHVNVYEHVYVRVYGCVLAAVRICNCA